MATEAAVPGRTIRHGAAILMYVLIALSYVVNAMDRSVFSNLVKAVTTEFHLSLAQGGLLSTIYAIGFGLTGVFAGYLLDRWARKSVMLVGIVIYSVFTLVMPLSQGFWDMTAYRVVTGVGEAMQQTAIFTMAGVFFARRRNLAIGGLNVAYGLGSFLGPILGTQIYLNSGASWRPPLVVFGILGLAFAAIVMVTLSRQFSEHAPAAALEHDIPSGPGSGGWLSRDVVLLSVANMMIGGVNYGYVGLYPSFLKAELHFSASAAAFAQSWYGIGAFTGIVSGYLADRYGERKLVYLAVVGSAASGLLLFDVARAPWQQVVLSFLFGTFGSGFLFVNIYALTQRSVRARHVGKASGLASSAHYLGAGFAGALLGGMVQAWGWSIGATLQMVLMPAVALVCVLFVRAGRGGRTPGEQTHSAGEGAVHEGA